jgi:hypothetical protein
MVLFKRLWRCAFCSRKYKSWGFHLVRHFVKYHPDERIKVVEVVK